MLNLPTELLRSYLAVIDFGGFTRAGEVVGRSQPAVSLQIKRLEKLVGYPLLRRSGRTLLPTEEGTLLLKYARQMLQLNDELVKQLVRPEVSGRVRLGIPNEFAASFLPNILGRFSKVYPDVSLEVICDLSGNLLQRLQYHELDLAIVIHPEPVDPQHRVWSEELVWVRGVDFADLAQRPLPVVVAPQPCVYRERLLRALDANALPWRITYTGTSYNGIRAAVMAGLGVTVLARSTIPEGLELLSYGAGFPALAKADVALHFDSESATQAVQHLATFITGMQTNPLFVTQGALTPVVTHR